MSRSEEFHYGVKPKRHTLDRGTERGPVHDEWKYRSAPTQESRPMPLPRRSDGGVSTAH